MSTDPSNAAVRALRIRYERSLGGKLEMLRARWSACGGGGWAEEPGRGLRTAVHQLAGSAASFGLAAIGLAAAQLDNHFKTLCAQEPKVDFPDARAAMLFTALYQAIERERQRLAGADD